MGLSTGRGLHVDQNLTQMAINYRPTGMIADQIFPVITVDKQTNQFPVFNQAEAFAIESTIRAKNTRAQMVTRSVSSDNYYCENYALAHSMPIEDWANMDAAYAFELQVGAGQYLLDKLWLDWDRRVLSKVGSATNVSTGFLPASSWTGANGDPISQIFQVIEQVQATTAYRPNKLIYGWRAYNFMRRNQQVRNFVLGLNNGGGTINRAQIAQVFEVEQVLVANAFYNTAGEGRPLALGNTFPSDAVLAYYCPPNPSKVVPSFAYTFRWQTPELPAPLSVERHPYDSREKSQAIEVGFYQDEKITSAALGALLLGVGSSQANGLA